MSEQVPLTGQLLKSKRSQPVRSQAIRFRQLSRADFDLLFVWLNTPHVSSRWGGAIGRPDFERQYGENLSSPNYFAYVASIDGEDFGFVQSYRASQVGDGWWVEITDPSVFGLDYFIGCEKSLGRGLGSLLIAQFVKLLRETFVVSKVISDPPPDNPASIRSLEKAGFVKRGIINTPDGPAQLMEFVSDSAALDCH
jgi:aminoglycoside 6'-N-acetyltransferase